MSIGGISISMIGGRSFEEVVRYVLGIGHPPHPPQTKFGFLRVIWVFIHNRTNKNDTEKD